jgi:hypothetical protein
MVMIDSNAAADRGRSGRQRTGNEILAWPSQDLGSAAAARADVAAAPIPGSPGPASGFLAELARAMRSAAEAARDAALAQFQSTAEEQSETIRTTSEEATSVRRSQADADVEAVRAWAINAIEQIRAQEAERVSARQLRLEEDLAALAERTSRAVEEVAEQVAAYESMMQLFFERLLPEEDPARFASLAGQLPEAPRFRPWSPDSPGSVAGDRPGGAEGWPQVDQSAPPPLGPQDFAAAEAEAAISADADDLAAGDGGGPPITAPAVATAISAAVDAEGTDAAEHTDVVVVGLVNVSGIATFKRVLGRAPGIRAVHVTSGPGGEFVFRANHEAGLDVAAIVTAMHGFDARLGERSGDVINVTAHDPDDAGAAAAR